MPTRRYAFCMAFSSGNCHLLKHDAKRADSLRHKRFIVVKVRKTCGYLRFCSVDLIDLTDRHLLLLECFCLHLALRAVFVMQGIEQKRPSKWVRLARPLTPRWAVMQLGLFVRSSSYEAAGYLLVKSRYHRPSSH